MGKKKKHVVVKLEKQESIRSWGISYVMLKILDLILQAVVSRQGFWSVSDEAQTVSRKNEFDTGHNGDR